MTKVAFFLLFLTSFAGALKAVVPLNDQHVLDVLIARKGLTRLSVKDDIIQDIFAWPSQIGPTPLGEIVQLHKSGHVFIATEGLKEPFYLTVITQKGHVQDLKLVPSSSKSAPLVLTLPEPSPQGTPDKSRYEGFLLSALQGITPPGFMFQPLSKTPLPSMGPLLLTPLGIYRSDACTLQLLEAENTGEREITLLPAMVLSASDQAVVFEKSQLPAGGKTRLALLRIMPPPALSSLDVKPLSREAPPHAGARSSSPSQPKEFTHVH